MVEKKLQIKCNCEGYTFYIIYKDLYVVKRKKKTFLILFVFKWNQVERESFGSVNKSSCFRAGLPEEPTLELTSLKPLEGSQEENP